MDYCSFLIIMTVTYSLLSFHQLAVDWGRSSDGAGDLFGYWWVWLPCHGCHQHTQDEICSPEGLFQWDWHSWVPQVGGAGVSSYLTIKSIIKAHFTVGWMVEFIWLVFSSGSFLSAVARLPRWEVGPCLRFTVLNPGTARMDRWVGESQ